LLTQHYRSGEMQAHNLRSLTTPRIVRIKEETNKQFVVCMALCDVDRPRTDVWWKYCTATHWPCFVVVTRSRSQLPLPAEVTLTCGSYSII